MFSPPFVRVNGVNMTFLLPIHIYNIYLKSVLNTLKVEYSQWANVCVLTSNIASESAGFNFWGRKSVTFPINFTNRSAISVNIYERPDYWNSGADSLENNSVNIMIAGNVNKEWTVCWLAIGC